MRTETRPYSTANSLGPTPICVQVLNLGRRLSLVAIASISLAGLPGCGGSDDDDPPVSDITTLSNRADLVSGGDVLVEIKLPATADPRAVHVSLNNSADVTSAFQTRPDGRFVGLVTGLAQGKNALSVSIGSGPSKTLEITNHPQGGPVFSGPQLQPWRCETDNTVLGPAVDAQCNAKAPVVDYVYKSTDSSKVALIPYDSKSPPVDVAMTTLDNGKTVPFIVRRETGTLNRGIYAVAVVADPQQAVSAAQPPAAWNGGLWYVLFGGAMPQYRQGPIGGALAAFADPRLLVVGEMLQLSKGYLTAASSLTVFGQQTNSIVSAETVMMVKERIIKNFGEIQYTLSTGASGGSIQQNLIANAYPGLIDGINPSATFPDVWTTNTEAQDCSLLTRYFDSTSPSLWSSVAQQDAVMDNANASPGTCRAWVQVHGLDSAWNNPSSTSCFYDGLTFGSPTGTTNALPWMFSDSNLAGARCTLQDYQRNIFGLRGDSYANRPYDNTGVQYGLKALKAGVISVDQFLDMNEKVGGRDINWKPTALRSIADAAALTAVYNSGELNLMSNTATTPIVDDRSCGNTEIHSCFNSFKLRERLRQSTGSIANHVMLIDRPATDSSAFDLLAAWVKSIKADKSSDSLAVKVVKNKPAGAVDACWIGSQRVTDPAQCSAAKPYFGDPRTGAGAPITVSASKCQLVAADRSSYGIAISDSQWAKLQSVFPDGVCDWTKPGVGQSAATPWLTYAAAGGGVPLPVAPVAK